MTALPQEPWPGLSGLGLADVGATDSRAALLVLNAELFAAAPTRDREIVETFESLALGFIPRMDHATLVRLARILAPCEDTPPAVLERLLRHSSETRSIVLDHMVEFSPALVKRLLGTADGRLRLASHPALNATTVDHLLVMHEHAVEDALAANRCILPTGPAMRELIRRARHRPSLAAVLLARVALCPGDEAALYLAADPERRKAIRERLATDEPILPPMLELTDYETAALMAAARAGDIPHFETLLRYAFRLAPETEWRFLAAGRYDLLALALKGIGLPERDAIAILFHLHPALSASLATIKSLVRTMRSVPRAVAIELVRTILGAPDRSRTPSRPLPV
ncbi:DUF2336 domain-containing protein [Microvirga rosea]|uniref:DUF2336 domain-containing protein n=1 Tax=Microvirga rosea TaxID=2715425 RepID=UPI001D09FA3D|nr:DUF2336 domain-containing protein [Microvirga rosea]MCB8820084.1 DUF2336 domain-containing protein [Microvirga rosea]